MKPFNKKALTAIISLVILVMLIIIVSFSTYYYINTLITSSKENIEYQKETIKETTEKNTKITHISLENKLLAYIGFDYKEKTFNKNVDITYIGVDKCTGKVGNGGCINGTGGINISIPPSNKLTVKLSFLVINNTPSLTYPIYELPISVQENSGTNLTDYQILINITDPTIISHIARDDCGDIRIFENEVTDPYNDTIGKLPYWIEECNKSNYTVLVWTKINVTANSQKTIYMYYGNPSATSESNLSEISDFYEEIVHRFYESLGAVPLTYYDNGIDPGDYFINCSYFSGVYICPVLWFRVYGGKHYAVGENWIYIEGRYVSGNYGTNGIDIRIRTTPLTEGWYTSEYYGADALITDKKTFVILYYNSTLTAGDYPEFSIFESWYDYSDIPKGTVITSLTVPPSNGNISKAMLYTDQNVSHIVIRSGCSSTYGIWINITKMEISIFKKATIEPNVTILTEQSLTNSLNQELISTSAFTISVANGSLELNGIPIENINYSDWYNIVITKDDGVLLIFLNGKEINSTHISEVPIGEITIARGYTGIVDEILVSDEPISKEEAIELSKQYITLFPIDLYVKLEKTLGKLSDLELYLFENDRLLCAGKINSTEYLTKCSDETGGLCEVYSSYTCFNKILGQEKVKIKIVGTNFIPTTKVIYIQ